MDGYRLSRTADRRLAEIYAYSVLTFGRSQARDYFNGVQDAFERLVVHPEIGSPVAGRPLVRRLVHRRHSIFYEIREDGIFILTILGAGQDPERHLTDG